MKTPLSAEQPTGERSRTLILVALWIMFFILPLGNRGLWPPDEPRYLQVSWEMAESRQFVVPQLNGESYAHKPPLFFWLTILLSGLTGFATASRAVFF